MFDFKFDWDSSMNIGHEIIDIQHQEFFRIARDVEQLVIVKCIGVEKKKLFEVICDLREFITYHFYFEEEIMKSINYPKFEEHKFTHDQFRKDILDFKCDIMVKEPYKSMVNLKTQLQEWVFMHMLVEDVKMIPELKKHNLI